MSALRSVLLPTLRGHRRRLATALGSSALVAAASLAHPFPLKIVLDHLVAADGTVSMEGGTVRIVVIAAGLALTVAIVEAVAGYVSEVGLQRTGEDVVHDLRVSVHDHLQLLSLAFHQRSHTGDLVTRLTGDVNATGRMVAESAGRTWQSLVLLVGMAVVTIRIDVVLAATVFVLVPPLALVTVRFRRRLKAASRRQRRQDGHIAATTTEALSAAPTVRALGATEVEGRRLAASSWARRDAGVEASTIEGRFAGLIDVMGAIGSTAVLVLGVVRVASGQLSPGDLVVVHSYARKLYRPLRDLARESGRISRAMARVERIGDVLRADDILADPPNGLTPDKVRGELRWVGVTHRHQEDREKALDDIDLVIPAGSCTALVGASGAGKSTLAALAARFHDPDIGRVELDGHDLRDYSLPWLRRQFGFVLQDTNLFTGTVADNISYGVDATRDEVVAAASIAGVHAFVVDLPNDYDTEIGPDGLALSGGQRRRLSIARAVLRDPPILILDEPTTGLDADTVVDLLDGLDALMRNRTTLLVTHDLDLAARADHVVEVGAGTVVGSGPPRRVLNELGSSGGGLSERGSAEGGAVGVATTVPVPEDPGLPQLPALLDPERVVDLLQRGQEVGVDHARVEYLRWKPGTNLVVLYDVRLEGGDRTHAVAMVAADRNLAKRTRRPVATRIVRQGDWRFPVGDPIRHDVDMDALVQWLPADIWLPAMSDPPEQLLGSVSHPWANGSHPPLGEHAEPPELLSYKPRRRAVLGIGGTNGNGPGYVVKVYADPVAFRAAAQALLTAPRLQVPTPGPAGIDADRNVTVQRRLAGAPADAVCEAEVAGDLARRLHGARTRRPIHATTCADVLGGAAASARLVTLLEPTLGDRLQELLARLERHQPADGTPVVSHGDYHVKQLLVGPDGPVLLDLDELCLGPAALDLATFAAHELDGTARGDGRADEVLAGVLDGYGSTPADLDWHLAVAALRRAPFPFRKPPLPDWPGRIEAMVARAERSAPC